MKTALSASIVGLFLGAFGVVSADAQDLKAMLIKPTNGWVIEWATPTLRDSGVTEVVFQDRGEKVVAKLNITDLGASKAGKTSCERDVTITAGEVRLDGCRDQNAVLIYDTNDKVYPLKTKTTTVNGYDWKLREK